MRRMSEHHRGPWSLPEGWRWSTLGEVCEINPRRPSLDRDDNTPTSFLPMAAVDERRGVIADLQVKPFGEVKRGYTYFPEGAVLFAKITPCMQNGKSAIARGLVDGIGFGSTEFHVLEPRKQVIPEWVHMFIRQASFREEAAKHFRGAVGQQRVPADFLETFPISLPPTIDIQRRIVARVEATFVEIGEVSRLYENVIQDTQELVDAGLEEAFGKLDPEKLSFAAVMREKPRNGWSPKCGMDTRGVPVLKLGAVLGFEYNSLAVKYTDQPVDQEAYYWLEPGDVLISRSNTSDLVGHAAVYSGHPYPCIYPDLLIRVRIKEMLVDPRFVIYWLRGHKVRNFIADRARGASSTMKKISQRDVMDLPFPRISLVEQQRIADYLDQIQTRATALKLVQGAVTAELQDLQQSILARAFRGEL